MASVGSNKNPDLIVVHYDDFARNTAIRSTVAVIAIAILVIGVLALLHIFAGVPVGLLGHVGDYGFIFLGGGAVIGIGAAVNHFLVALKRKHQSDDIKQRFKGEEGKKLLLTINEENSNSFLTKNNDQIIIVKHSDEYIAYLVIEKYQRRFGQKLLDYGFASIKFDGFAKNQSLPPCLSCGDD